jgi:hypothetical protein
MLKRDRLGHGQQHAGSLWCRHLDDEVIVVDAAWPTGGKKRTNRCLSRQPSDLQARHTTIGMTSRHTISSVT